jgi:hypothetical protein
VQDGVATRVTAHMSLLLGAGFSRSAGILTAAEIVEKQLRVHALLVDAPSTPAGQTDYTFLMSRLPPIDRADVIRKAIDAGGGRINWAHLLLATLVEAGYVRRILTTNFDPLIVDALAVMGQPVRAFDLASSGHYLPNVLSPGAVVYLHGQAHSLILSNTPEELERLRQPVRSVLEDAVSDSTLVVIGYSGEGDFVFRELEPRSSSFRAGCSGSTTARTAAHRPPRSTRWFARRGERRSS